MCVPYNDLKTCPIRSQACNPQSNYLNINRIAPPPASWGSFSFPHRRSQTANRLRVGRAGPKAPGHPQLRAVAEMTPLEVGPRRRYLSERARDPSFYSSHETLANGSTVIILPFSTSPCNPQRKVNNMLHCRRLTWSLKSAPSVFVVIIHSQKEAF